MATLQPVRPFILDPHGTSPHAQASRDALLTYATKIAPHNPFIAQDVLEVIAREAEYAEKLEKSGTTSCAEAAMDIFSVLADLPPDEVESEKVKECIIKARAAMKADREYERRHG